MHGFYTALKPLLRNLLLFAGGALCVFSVSCGAISLAPLEVLEVSCGQDSIAVMFSGCVDRESVCAGFSFYRESEKVQALLRVDGNAVLVTPLCGLEDGWDYTVTFSQGTRAVDGSSMEEDFLYVLKKKSGQDRPKVLDFRFVDGESPFLEFTFSEAVDCVSFQNALSISPPQEYALLWNEAKDSVSVMFLQELPCSTRFTVELSTALSDLSHNFLAEKFRRSFENCMDSEPPVCSVYLLADGGGRTELADGTVLDSVPGTSLIRLEFSEAVDEASVRSAFSLGPALDWSMEFDSEEKRSASVKFGSAPEWGSSCTLTLLGSFCDAAGNECGMNFECALVFKAPECMPPKFLCAHLVLPDSTLKLNPETDYSTLLLPVQDFPYGEEVPAVCVFVFALSPCAKGLDTVSAMKNISVSATNSCVFPSLRYIKELCGEDALLSPYAPNDEECNICVLEFGMTITNYESGGLVRFEVSEGLSDVNNNCLGKKVRLTYIKK